VSRSDDVGYGPDQVLSSGAVTLSTAGSNKIIHTTILQFHARRLERVVVVETGESHRGQPPDLSPVSVQQRARPDVTKARHIGRPQTGRGTFNGNADEGRDKAE